MLQNWERLSRMAIRYGWLVFLTLCALIGYMVIWDRGLNYDDYFWQANTIVQNLQTVTAYRVRPLHHLLNALWPLFGQFAARLIASALSLAVSLLAGWLVMRVTRSRLAGFVTACCTLLPFSAYQAVLWRTGYNYPFATLFGLLSMHGLLSTSELVEVKQKLSVIWWSVISFVIALLFVEPVISLLVVVPFIVIIPALSKHRSFSKALRAVQWRPLVLAALVVLIILVVLYYALYRPSTFVAVRGEFDFSLLGVFQRIQSHWLPSLPWLLVNPDFGGGVNSEAFELGIDQLNVGWVGSLLFLLVVIGLGFLVAKWQPDSAQDSPPSSLAILLMIFIGLILAASTYLIPGAFVSNQIAEIRLLYMPTIFLAIAVGAAVASIMRFLGGQLRLWITRVLIGLVGVWTLYSAVTMLGLSALYQARGQLDSRQIAQLVERIPRRLLRVDSPYYVIYQWSEDDSVFDYETPLNNALFGVFETTWSLNAVLSSHYREYALQPVISHRWDPFLRFTFEDSVLRLRDLFIPPDRAIVFSYQEGEIVLYESLTLVAPDGYRQIVPLPLGQSLAEHGSPSVDTLEVTTP